MKKLLFLLGFLFALPTSFAADGILIPTLLPNTEIDRLVPGETHTIGTLSFEATEKRITLERIFLKVSAGTGRNIENAILKNEFGASVAFGKVRDDSILFTNLGKQRIDPGAKKTYSIEIKIITLVQGEPYIGLRLENAKAISVISEKYNPRKVGGEYPQSISPLPLANANEEITPYVDPEIDTTLRRRGLKIESLPLKKNKFPAGNKEILLAKIHLESIDSNNRLSRITFETKTSAILNKLYNLKLRVNGQDILPLSKTGNRLSFVDVASVSKDEEQIIELFGDFAEDIPEQEEIYFLVNSDSLTIQNESTKELSVALGIFPLLTSSLFVGESPEDALVQAAIVPTDFSFKRLQTKQTDLVFLEISAANQGAIVTELRLNVTGDISGMTAQNLTLFDEYGNPLSSGTYNEKEKILLFSAPFTLPQDEKHLFRIQADINAFDNNNVFFALDEESLRVERTPSMDTPILKIDTSKTQNITFLADPNDSRSYLTVQYIPNTPTIIAPGKKSISFGSLVFTPDRRDFTIDRIQFQKQGGDHLENLRLTDGKQTITGLLVGDTLIFSHSFAIPTAQSRSFELLADIGLGLDPKETFAFSLKKREDIAIRSSGSYHKEVIVGVPLTSFAVQAEKNCATALVEPVCAAVISEEIPQEKNFSNSCEVERARAAFIRKGSCLGEAEKAEEIPSQEKISKEQKEELEEKTPLAPEEISEKAEEILPPLAEEKEEKRPSFSDITENHANAEAISYLKETDIVKGFDDGSFRPEKEISRAAFLKIVIGSAFPPEEINSCSETTFSDVPLEEWFTPYVCLAQKEGIIKGFDDETFRPGKNISFAAAAKIISRTLGDKNIVEDGDTWYKNFVQYLEEQNAIPMTIGTLDKNITRGEMAEIIWRILEEIKEKPSQIFLGS